MGQIIYMRRTRRHEADLCPQALVWDENWISGESNLIHRCKEVEGHRGPHQCFCGIVYRDDGTIWVPQPLPGFGGGAWTHP